MDRRAAGALLACGCAAGGVLHAALAQKPAPQPPRFHSGVELVLMDVTVLDRNRQPVRGLHASDFSIVEETVSQPVVSFTEVSVPGVDGSVAPWMREVAPDVRTNSSDDRRVVLVVLDDASVSHQWTEYVKKIGRAIVDRLGPTDVASVVYTATQKKGQELTSDRTRLRDAVERYADTTVPGELQAGYTVGTLRKLVEYMMDIPQRRKALFFVSTLRLDLATGAVASNLSQPGAGEAAAAMRDRASELTDLLLKAQRANVSIYPVSPAGLQPNATDAGSTEETLQGIGNATGGFAIVNRNDFDGRIAQVFRESGAYYVLGFQSAHSDGKFRRIDVRVNRPGLTVVTRTGYVAPKPDAERDRTAPNALTKAISGLLPATDLPMRVSAAPFASARAGESSVAIALGIREQVPGGGERIPETVDLLASAFAPDGKLKATRKLTARLSLRPTADREAKYEVLSELDLKPGRYTLRFAARSLSLAASGSVYEDVEVPDFAKPPVSLSGVVIGVTPALPAAPRDLLQPLLPVVPTTQREFVRGVHEATAFVRVYAAGKPSVGIVPLRAAITNERDVRVFGTTRNVEPQPYGSIRAADYTLALPIAELEPGGYLLTFEAGAARRDVRFTIR